MIKKTILTFILSALLLGVSHAQNKNKRETSGMYLTNFEAVCEGTGTEGTQLFKIYFYFKREKNAGMHAKENAVKAILFQGIPAGKGCVKRGLVTEDDYLKNKAWFDAFFAEQGPYLMYVNLVGEGMIERVKMPKKNYKAAWVVSVNYDNLRRKLEDEGIIKGLNSGF